MARKRVLLIALAPVLLLVLTVGYMYAQGPAPQAEPRGREGGHPQAPLGPQAQLGARTPLGSAFTYQGQLKDSGGNPIDDTCDFTFGLWDAESAGAQVGSDSVVTGVAVTNGYFAVNVNAGGEFGAGAFTGDERWLEVAVQCSADPAPVTLSPRQLLSAAPYAFTLQPGAVISGTVTGGRGVLDVINNNSTSGAAVRAYATGGSGDTRGVYAQSSSSLGEGVFGYASALTGDTCGVHGQSDSLAGHGVYGYASASSGDTCGVHGQSSSTRGHGVFGSATASSGTTYGVYGLVDSTGGYGVFGHASAISGFTYGVYGWVDSTDGHGVYGLASATSGSTYGVYGSVSSTDGYGVLGFASASSGSTYGVYGRSISTSGTGVYGRAAAMNADYGVYSNGNIGGTGTKSAIVQTQDYGWRHLYAMESPDVLFEDVGTALLVNGQAVVMVEPVFAQTVNLEEDYQVFLTPLSAKPVLLFVTAKTAQSFTVRGVTLGGQPADASFDYRIIAKRWGYEDIRLAPAADPTLSGEAPEREVAP